MHSLRGSAEKVKSNHAVSEACREKRAGCKGNLLTELNADHIVLGRVPDDKVCISAVLENTVTAGVLVALQAEADTILKNRGCEIYRE